MISTLVSARVPQAKKDAATGILSSLGATVSDLINAAFDYVIAHHEIPRAEKTSLRSPDDFRAFVEATSFSVNWNPDELEMDYKQLMRKRRINDYEFLGIQSGPATEQS